jgi:hypothetical protein
VEYNLSFEKLMELCSKKILSKVPKQPGTMVGAFNGGDYLGRPGKDIFFALPKLTEEQFDKVVQEISLRFPHNPPNNHVGYAGCIRYIYGQFEKQGILRSEEDLKRMQGEDIDWGLPRKFMFALRDKFLEQKNYYGLCIFYEMEAHRLGDESFLNDDKEKREDMEWHYAQSVKYAYKCGSLKQMFTPQFWCFKYYARLGDHQKALDYVLKTLEQMEKHCPSSKQGYLVKAQDCAKYMKKHHPNKWKEILSHYKKSAKNDCIRKLVKKC